MKLNKVSQVAKYKFNMADVDVFDDGDIMVTLPYHATVNRVKTSNN